MSDGIDGACEDCRFWESINDTIDDIVRDGQCRRHAPRVVMRPKGMDGEMMAVWPLTRPDDWCGEWRAKPLDWP